MGILALLSQEPMHGYQLRVEFERRTGETWPINVGQVYTTLGRLERDGLVASASDGDSGEAAPYLLTPAGHEAVAAWWATPVERTAPARDELAIKLALAVSVPGVDVTAVVQHQRRESLRVLRDYTRLQAAAAKEPQADLAWSLVLDHLVFGLEAELRWLDHTQARLGAAPAHPDRGAAPAPVDAPAPASAPQAAR